MNNARVLGRITALVLTALLAVLVPSCGDDAPAASCAEPGEWSIAREWNEATLDAIRLDYPVPTVHARNLFHLSAAIWDAWAAYDPDASGVYYAENHTPPDGITPAEARHEAISHAAYTLLQRRYGPSRGGTEAQAAFDAIMQRHCHGLDASDDPEDPSAIGRRIAGTIIGATIGDGSQETLMYLDRAHTPVNPPLSFAERGTEMDDPNRWQPLEFTMAVPQYGLDVAGGVQTFSTPQWASVAPFALAPGHELLDPGPPPLYGEPADMARFLDDVVEVIRASAALDPSSDETIDLSPGGAGTDVVPLGDWARAIAEYWADGPDSETPPGHWNRLANELSDHPDLELRIGGSGPVVERLEWDIRLHLALNGALHDAAIAAWAAKERYDSSRPISQIRYLGGLGQSSDPTGAAYDPLGLPLVEGLIEVVTEATTASGERHEHLAAHIGEIAIRSWHGPGSAAPGTDDGDGYGVAWILAVDWIPYQRDTFVTPAFPGYVSGHSAFSSAAARMLAHVTGDPSFPGGVGSWTIPAGGLQYENGPSVDVTLQWATYDDAAAEAGISRIYGGIHVPADDEPGRAMGRDAADIAWAEVTDLWGIPG